MSAFFFYKNRKPRKFNYKPILYDPEEEARKERLERRIQERKREMGVLPEGEKEVKKDFKPEFVSQTRHLKKRKSREAAGQNPFYTKNWVLIIAVIVLLGLFFLWILS
ncbi:MAG: hypothetical protein GX371_03610 [Bacteroidales bacterium]|jgi:hypothetical protein|nr:hypothetical protein [Bacteroidales bacterium]